MVPKRSTRCVAYMKRLLIGMNDLDGRYGQNLISRLLFEFHVRGVVWAGKCAICDRVHLLKL